MSLRLLLLLPRLFEFLPLIANAQPARLEGTAVNAGGMECVYVKSLLLGQTLVDGSTLDLSNGSGGQSLSVRLSSAVSQLSGTVKDGDKAAPGMDVMIVSDEPGLPRNTRMTTSDSAGGYTFPGLPPGKYKVVAVKAGGGSILATGKLPDEYQAVAHAVELAPKDVVTRDLKLH